MELKDGNGLVAVGRNQQQQESDMRKIKTLWFVVDQSEGQLSWSADAERGESFQTFDKAQKRAAKLAQQEPHKIFLICQATHCVAAAVGPSVTAKIGA